MTQRRAALVPAMAVWALCAAIPAAAADAPAITVYRSDSPALYASRGDGDAAAGYAVVHETRALDLAAGTHDIAIDDLPATFDAEALALAFPGQAARTLAQRATFATDAGATLASLVGHAVDVLGTDGQVLAGGELRRAGSTLLVRDANGRDVLVTQYAAVRARDARLAAGSTLTVRVDARRAGPVDAALTYPMGGIGWRAAYVATLLPGNSCRMAFTAQASIANRSGRDWHGARLTLVAGEPNLAKNSAPRPMMAMAQAYDASMAKRADLPAQDSLGDYRTYSLPAALDLPDASVTQVPLYAPRTMDCTRVALYTSGSAYTPPRPVLNPDFNTGGVDTVASVLGLRAFGSLPAGYLRVLTADRSGVPQFIGEGHLGDTPKGGAASITLGTAFDLRAHRERTAFHVDAAAHRMDEAFRVTLTNAGETARTITVREYPARWRQWTLAASSSKPSAQSPDLLEFSIDVPAHGERTLDYALRYTWSAADLPP